MDRITTASLSIVKVSRMPFLNCRSEYDVWDLGLGSLYY